MCVFSSADKHVPERHRTWPPFPGLTNSVLFKTVLSWMETKWMVSLVPGFPIFGRGNFAKQWPYRPFCLIKVLCWGLTLSTTPFAFCLALFLASEPPGAYVGQPEHHRHTCPATILLCSSPCTWLCSSHHHTLSRGNWSLRGGPGFYYAKLNSGCPV